MEVAKSAQEETAMPPAAKIAVEVGMEIEIVFLSPGPKKRIVCRIVRDGGGKVLDDGTRLVTSKAPLAKALMGRVEGEIVRFPAPDGTLQKVRIERVAPWTKTTVKE